jgi:DNA-binding response OmpR family regulator
MSTTSKAQPATILIIDDVPTNLEILSECLEAASLEVVAAQDGAAGLTIAQRARPDLILLDVLMPGLDGFETCRRLKAAECTHDLPVIFMTGLTETANKVTGFEVGGVDYVTKPFQVEEVLARVKTHLALRKLQQQLEAQNVRLQQEIAERMRAEAQREQLIGQLQEALANIKTLRGLVPICAACKKIRDDRGYWNQLESYLLNHTEAQFSHGICPECIRRLYPDLADEIDLA